MFLPELMAAANTASIQQNPITQFLPFILVFFVFYFLIIRPQQKKAKIQRQLIENLKKGDKVVTTFGLYGTINKVFDNKDYILLDIAEKITVKIQKGQINETINTKN